MGNIPSNRVKSSQYWSYISNIIELGINLKYVFGSAVERIDSNISEFDRIDFG
jgi:hypothetical protein